MKTAKLDFNDIKECPFCHSTNLNYSIKIRSSYSKKYMYHCCIYCKNCNTYGPRIRIETTNNLHYMEERVDIFNKCKEKWNNR